MAKYHHPSSPLVLLTLLSAFAAAVVVNSLTLDICKTLVQTQGYPCEEHQVTSEDGYIIGLHRIPSGRSGTNSSKLPVLLHHGFLMDAATWVLNPQDQALGFILADKGFDVWLANARGTQASRGHTRLNPALPEYWEWSWDQSAAHDLPAMFDYVNKQTGQKVHYAGHSLGTLTVLASLSQQKLTNTVRSVALLSPVAYLGGITTLLGKIAATAYTAENLYNLGFREYPPPGEQGTLLQKFLCSQPGVDCSDFMSAVTGPNCCITSASSGPFAQHTPQTSSTKNAVHLSQMIRTNKIAMFDYGPLGNIRRYGRPTPPEYDMASIPKDVPLFFGYGGKDALSDVSDVKGLLADLSDHQVVEQFVDEYAHMDFIMAGNVNENVYAPLLAFFNQH